ncbi:high-affinity branched-chain amino acid ABC transporter permease LivM [Tianweitania aestuarii]|uniref:high-affinity branched-chain amino acid ABC transporter permease LivM n=1 Tax=Tianweitania aestuarii TaxID=2814886 RepID=UPI003D6514FF
MSDTTTRQASSPYGEAARQALWAALLSFGLFFFFIGLESTQDISNRLILQSHWVTLAIVVALVALGRFLFIAFVIPAVDRRRANRAPIAVVDEKDQSFIRRHRFKIMIALLVLYPIFILSTAGLQGSLKWVNNFGVQVLIYVMLAWGLNIVVGLAGLLDLGYVAFYAVGAYAYALLGTEFGLSFWILLPAAGIMAAFWGIILGFPVLRLRGDYLAIVTLAFGEIIRLVLINWREVTNGSAGISGIPKITFFGLFDFNISSPDYILKVLPESIVTLFALRPSGAYYTIFLYYLILALAMLTAFVTIRLRRLPVGRAWEALREDEIACRSLGINTTNTKLTAFAIGAMFGGFAGAFFAARQGFINPESFVFLQSAIILAIVVLGGMGSLSGIAIAALVMIGGMEILREMQFLKIVFGQSFTPELYRMLLFGIAMVVVMVWKPRGFVGSREPTAYLKEARAVSSTFTKEGHG